MPVIKPAEIPQIRSRTSAPAAASSTSTTTAVTSPTAEPEKKPFQSRFLQSRTTVDPPKKEESESSSEEESSEESESEEETPKVKPTPVVTSPVRSTANGTTTRASETVTPRTGILKDSTTTENRRSFEETTLPSRSRYETPSSTYSRTSDKENETSRYGTRSRPTYEAPEEPSR